MKKSLVYLALCVQSIVCMGVMQLQVTSTATSALKLKIIAHDTVDKVFLSRLAQDLVFSKQFEVSIIQVSKPPKKRDIIALAKQGYALALVITPTRKQDTIEWRLYDSFKASMIAGKDTRLSASTISGVAHHVADQIWPIVTSQPGFFSTKIAYCKVIDGRSRKAIYIADFDGSNEQLLTAARYSVVAPRWNLDPANPLVFYSEYTDTNARLVSTDMRGRRRIASNFEGINMLPNFDRDSGAVVYCASKGRGNGQLFYYKDGVTKQLTNNQANNFSPAFAADSATIYYCSDCCKGIPQLFSYNVATQKTEQITHQGSSVDPHYCATNNKLVYARSVGGVMQLFVYDIATDTHQQITSGEHHKQEPAWSACGNYILYVQEQGGRSNLMIYNRMLGTAQKIGDPRQNYSSPSWSICYTYAPMVEVESPSI